MSLRAALSVFGCLSLLAAGGCHAIARHNAPAAPDGGADGAGEDLDAASRCMANPPELAGGAIEFAAQGSRWIGAISCDPGHDLLGNENGDATTSCYESAGSWTAPGRCAAAELQINSYETLQQRDPAVAFLSSGKIVVAWESQGEDGGASGPGGYGDFGIYARRWDPETNALGGAVRVNGAVVYGQFSPAVVPLPAGGLVIAWTAQNGDDGSGDGVIAARFSDSLAKEIPDLVVNVDTAGDELHAAGAVLAGGGLVFVWQDRSYDPDYCTGGEVHARIFDAELIGKDPIKISSEDSNDCWPPSVAALGDGRFVVAWESLAAGTASVRARVHDATGAPAASSFLVSPSASAQTRPSVSALRSGKFVATWTEKLDVSRVFLRVFEAPGASTEVIPVDSESSQSRSAIASIADGGFVVVWEHLPAGASRWQIYGQIFDETGGRRGRAFQVNSRERGDLSGKRGPAIAASSGGSFVVVWEQADGQSSNDCMLGVFGRVFR